MPEPGLLQKETKEKSIHCIRKFFGSLEGETRRSRLEN